MALASEPNYLGSPEVVSHLISRLFEATVNKARKELTFSEHLNIQKEITSAFAGDDPRYSLMPLWHTKEALGKNLIEKFCLDEDYHDGEMLYFTVSEAIAGLCLHIDKMISQFKSDANAVWNPHALIQLNECHAYVVSVFLGTQMITHPGKILKDFSWKPVMVDQQTSSL